jgi:hypothetical protein
MNFRQEAPQPTDPIRPDPPAVPEKFPGAPPVPGDEPNKPPPVYAQCAQVRRTL